MTETALYFTGPETVDHRPVSVDPAADEVVVATDASAISAGSELLVYRDEVPTEMPVDETIEAFDDTFEYPLRYGYAAAGTVVETGSDVADEWLDRSVFGFRPHQTRFAAAPDDLVVLPDGVSPAHGCLLPTVETATNLVLDSEPKLDESVVVFGAGVVGLCTTRLLSAFPLDELVVVEPIAARREAATSMGAGRTLTPEAAAAELGDCDLAVELSGEPAVLNDAIDAVGYDGRVVVGSWYGEKRAPIDLGGSFHRDRIELVSSQVSTIDPARRGRWDRKRRFDTAVEWLDRLDCERLISHRIPFSEAADAYELLDERSEPVLQVVLTY
ncbi:zinc-dependent alcohol dehydrogenase [Halonotius roseus]|uniref:Zinc-binding alcohol dehydrogenase n=1 Tax=Halonotius roseus TaxID=2511997 RepID=A0A544QL38_9EURY|nr:zinc-binding alcohol dehydrogenase [Halonotius roseus]TQQ79082.1 zinc-binding alcohol dehydrogenase [Halonotius roseus]